MRDIASHNASPLFIESAIHAIRSRTEAESLRLALAVELREPELHDSLTYRFLRTAEACLERSLSSPRRTPTMTALTQRTLPRRQRSMSVPTTSLRPAIKSPLNALLTSPKPSYRVRFADEPHVTPASAPMRPIDATGPMSPGFRSALLRDRVSRLSRLDELEPLELGSARLPPLSSATPILRRDTFELTASPGAPLERLSGLTSPAARVLPSNLSQVPPSPVRRGHGPNTTLEYWDAHLGMSVTWLPFKHWLWRVPDSVMRVVDHNSMPIEVGSYVKLVARFRPHDEILAMALVSKALAPSAGSNILDKTVQLGERVVVLQIFNIQSQAWLACLPLMPRLDGTPRRPGLIPLRAVVVDGDAPAYLPRVVDVAIHSSARSYLAMFRTAGLDGQARTGRVTCIVTPTRLTYCAAPAGGFEGQPHWRHVRSSA